MDFLLELIKASLVGVALWLLLLCLKPITRRFFSQTWHYYISLIPLLFLLGASRLAVPAARFVTDLIPKHEMSGGTIAEISHGLSKGTELLYETALPQFYSVSSTTTESMGQGLVKRSDNLEILTPYLLSAWFAGVLVFLIIKCRAYVKFRRGVLHGSRPYNAGTLPVKVVVSDFTLTPMLMGAFKPVIVLPNRQYREGELEIVLSHELTHYKRGDVFIKLFLLLANAIHWFNPFVYIMNVNVGNLCENSCDEKLARNMDMAKRRLYGEMIISTIEYSMARRISLSAGLCAANTNIRRRLIHMLNSKKTKLPVMAISIALAVVIGATGVVLAYSASKTPTAPASDLDATPTASPEMVVDSQADSEAEPSEPTIAATDNDISATEPIEAAEPNAINNASDLAAAPESPYEIATTLEEVRAILARQDGTIPVTNIEEVPEIMSGEANGIIVREQDLDEALETLNYVHFTRGGYVLENWSTPSVETLLPVLTYVKTESETESKIEFDTCLNKYADFGVSFDETTKTWMFNDKPIGLLFDTGIDYPLMFINLPAGVDIEDKNLLDKLSDLDCVFADVPYERVGKIAGIHEITPKQAARRIQFTVKQFPSVVVADYTAKAVLELQVVK
ncbi:MAG: M56 family metallopeptidase [Clostridiales bacterium]|nr:M56 family metallopeptidase [Clostridiales bacterium]